MDQRSEIAQEVFSPSCDKPMLRRHLSRFRKSRISYVCVKLCKPNHDSISNGVNIGATPWNTEIRSDIAEGLVSDPPSGLLNLLRKKFSNLSNPESSDQRFLWKFSLIHPLDY